MCRCTPTALSAPPTSSSTTRPGNTYVGYAGLGEATDNNGCQNESVPLGTKVTFNTGGSLVFSGTQVGTGKLVYSSWRTMRAIGTTDENTCAYNDLALVQVDARTPARSTRACPSSVAPL